MIEKILSGIYKFRLVFLLLFLILFSFFIFSFIVTKRYKDVLPELLVGELDQVSVNIDANSVLNNDFAQILGGYINTRGNLDPSSSFVLSRQDIINEAKKMFPQPPEFPVSAVMRTQSYHMLSTDLYAITDREVEDVINFCSQAGCDPMFGAIGIDSTGKIDLSREAINRRVVFVKQKCDQYFNDSNHCLHWDIGNEPPSPGDNCGYYGNNLIPTAVSVIKNVFPNAIIHAPELYNHTSKVRDGTVYRNETIGECIARTIKESGSNAKIDVVTTHWYPYVCAADKESAAYVDGNAVLKWNGFGGPAYQSMLYPKQIVREMRAWMDKPEYQNITKGSAIGIGELNPMAACGRGESDIPGANVTNLVNTTWGGAFWHLDTLGIMAESGIKYVQKHIHISGGGGPYEAMIVSGSTIAKTAPYYAYSFYSQYFGRTIVNSTSSNPDVLNAHASIDKNGNIRVILINKSGSGFKAIDSDKTVGQTMRVNINVNNFNAGNMGETYTLKTPVDFITPGVNEVTTNRNVEVGNNFIYSVPAYSAVIVKIPNRNPGSSPNPTVTPTLLPGITPTPFTSPTPTPSNGSLDCVGICYGSITSCQNSCSQAGKTCIPLHTDEITNMCGWGQANPEWVTFRCCSGGGNRPIPTPIITPTPTNTPVLGTCVCEEKGLIYNNTLYQCSFNPIYQYVQFRITYQGYPIASMEPSYSQNNWYFVPNVGEVNLECMVCKNSSECSDWVKAK